MNFKKNLRKINAIKCDFSKKYIKIERSAQFEANKNRKNII